MEPNPPSTTYKPHPLFAPVTRAANFALSTLPFMLLIEGIARKKIRQFSPMMAASCGVYYVSQTAMMICLRKKDDKLNDIISFGLGTAPFHYKYRGFNGMIEGVVTTGIVYGLVTAAWDKSVNKEED